MRVLAAAFVLTASMCGTGLRVGRASLDITPPAGMPMGGYFEIRLNTGTHDPLHAKAVVLEQGGVKAALVACDLESVPRSLVERAHALVERTTGIPTARVLISATHTHTGPEMSHIFIDRLTEGPQQSRGSTRLRSPARSPRRCGSPMPACGPRKAGPP